jgi:hypothetical protein
MTVALAVTRVVVEGRAMNLLPAWMTLGAGTTPSRGRHFGGRNRRIGAAVMVAHIAAGHRHYL